MPEQASMVSFYITQRVITRVIINKFSAEWLDSLGSMSEFTLFHQGSCGPVPQTEWIYKPSEYRWNSLSSKDCFDLPATNRSFFVCQFSLDTRSSPTYRRHRKRRQNGFVFWSFEH